MNKETRAEQLEKLIEKQKEYIAYLTKWIGEKSQRMLNFESEIAALKKDSDHKENKEDDNIDLSSPDYWPCCKRCGNKFWTKTKIDTICESCKSSIFIQTFKSKEIEEVKSEISALEKQVEIMDEEVLKEARRQFREGYHYIFVSGAEFARKWYRDQIKTK